MSELTISRQIVSERLAKDGVPIRALNGLQQAEVERFVCDERMRYVSVDHCALCGGHDFVVVAERDQFGIPLETACCKGCGLVFSLNQLSESSSAIFYSEYYRRIYEGVEQATLDHGYYRRLYGGAVPAVPSFFDASQLVLEIGCGGGWNLLPYKQKGLSHVGFDYDANMIDFGRAGYGLNIFRGGLQEAVAQGVRANYVILSHVLEHVSDPVEFLIALRKVMAPGAVLRITVPCLDYLRFFGGSGTGYEFASNLQNAHNYFFSERTLWMTVRKAGYSVIVGVGGFCLAQKSSFADASVADKDTDAWGEVLQLIASSEKAGSRKKWLLGRIPSGLKRALPYVHLLARPLGVAKYVLVHKTSFGKYALAHESEAT